MLHVTKLFVFSPRQNVFQRFCPSTGVLGGGPRELEIAHNRKISLLALGKRREICSCKICQIDYMSILCACKIWQINYMSILCSCKICQIYYIQYNALACQHAYRLVLITSTCGLFVGLSQFELAPFCKYYYLTLK